MDHYNKKSLFLFIQIFSLLALFYFILIKNHVLVIIGIDYLCIISSTSNISSSTVIAILSNQSTSDFWLVSSLFLIVIVLLTKVIVFIFKHYSTRRIAHCESFLDVQKGPIETQICLKGPEQVPQHIPYDTIVNNYNNLFNSWIIYSVIKAYMDDITVFNKLYVGYIHIFTYSCFFVGWFYTFIYFVSVNP